MRDRTDAPAPAPAHDPAPAHAPAHDPDSGPDLAPAAPERASAPRPLGAHRRWPRSFADRLPRHTPLFVPAGPAGWFRRRGFTRVTDLDWWESATFVLSAEPVMEPLHRTLAAWHRAGLPREDLWDLPIGASRTLVPEASRTGG